jgi:hypothetical protein
VAAVGSVEQAVRRLCSQVKVRFDDPAVASEARAVLGLTSRDHRLDTSLCQTRRRYLSWS